LLKNRKTSLLKCFEISPKFLTNQIFWVACTLCISSSYTIGFGTRRQNYFKTEMTKLLWTSPVPKGSLVGLVPPKQSFNPPKLKY